MSDFRGLLSDAATTIFSDIELALLPNETTQTVTEYEKGLLILTTRRLLDVKIITKFDYKRGHSTIGKIAYAIPPDLIHDPIEKKRDEWNIDVETVNEYGLREREKKGRTSVIHTKTLKMKPSKKSKGREAFSESMKSLAFELSQIKSSLDSKYAFSSVDTTYIEKLREHHDPYPELFDRMEPPVERDAIHIPNLGIITGRNTFGYLMEKVIETWKSPRVSKIEFETKTFSHNNSDVKAITFGWNKIDSETNSKYLMIHLHEYSKAKDSIIDYMIGFRLGSNECVLAWLSHDVNQPWILSDAFTHLTSRRIPSSVES